MADPQIGTKGARVDLLIRQGATCGPNFTQIKDSGGAAIDLTDWTVTGQIRKTADAATIAATAVITGMSAVSGSFNFEFTATATAALTADPEDETAEASTYVWDLEMTNSVTSRVVPLLYGSVSVFREVTR